MTTPEEYYNDYRTDRQPNIPLLRKAVEWVEEQDKLPEDESEWWQSSWVISGAQIGRSCGTAYCVAGWVARQVVPELAKRNMMSLPSGHVLESQQVAEVELGISSNQANELFHEDNTAEDVRRIAEDIAGEAL